MLVRCAAQNKCKNQQLALEPETGGHRKPACIGHCALGSGAHQKQRVGSRNFPAATGTHGKLRTRNRRYATSASRTDSIHARTVITFMLPRYPLPRASWFPNQSVWNPSNPSGFRITLQVSDSDALVSQSYMTLRGFRIIRDLHFNRSGCRIFCRREHTAHGYCLSERLCWLGDV